MKKRDIFSLIYTLQYAKRRFNTIESKAVVFKYCLNNHYKNDTACLETSGWAKNYLHCYKKASLLWQFIACY